MLLETILAENGKYPLLTWHQDRIDKAFKELFSNKKSHKLATLLPVLEKSDKQKIRFLYDKSSFTIEVLEHHKRSIASVQCIRKDDIKYDYKYQDRTALHELYALRGNTDEILIIRNKLVTDAFYYNPVFWDGSGWYVPESYLLLGVRRSCLLYKERVKEITLLEKDLDKFEKMSLINALTDLGEIEIPIRNVLH